MREPNRDEYVMKIVHSWKQSTENDGVLRTHTNIKNAQKN